MAIEKNVLVKDFIFQEFEFYDEINTDEVKNLLNKLVENEKELKPTLNERQKQKYKEIEEAWANMSSKEIKTTFVVAFKKGFQLALEILGK